MRDRLLNEKSGWYCVWLYVCMVLNAKSCEAKRDETSVLGRQQKAECGQAFVCSFGRCQNSSLVS